MADKTLIEWTDATWNPITGCTLVDDGCRHCYAARLSATRLKHHPSRDGLARINAAGEAKFTGEVRFNEQWIDAPVGWRKPRMVFVCAHGDLFHPAVPDEWIDQVFATMAMCPQHTFQVLTKRPDLARAYLSADWAGRASQWVDMYGRLASHYTSPGRPYPLANVWLGTSVSDQASADARIPALLDTPASVRFVSAEPLLGPLDLGGYIPDLDCGDGLDWVIVGGESGPGARPMDPDWARALRDQCAENGTAFFMKQMGGARNMPPIPDDLMIREFPGATR